MVFCSSSQSSRGCSCHRETVQQADAELEPRTRRVLANNEMSHQGEAPTWANRSWTTALWSSQCCVWWMQGQRSESEERRGDHDTADQRHSTAIPARSPGAAGCDALQRQRVLQQRGGSVPRHHVDPKQHHRGRCVSAAGHSGCFYSFYLFCFFSVFIFFVLCWTFPNSGGSVESRNVRKSQLHASLTARPRHKNAKSTWSLRFSLPERSHRKLWNNISGVGLL